MVEIKLDISKRFLVFTSFLFAGLFLISFSFANSGQFNLPLPWVIDSNGNSVDSNNNGRVDDSDKLEGLSASDLAAATGTPTTGGPVKSNLIMFDENVACPSGYQKVAIPAASHSNGRYVHVSKDQESGAYHIRSTSYDNSADWTWYYVGSYAHNIDLVYRHRLKPGKTGTICIEE